MRVMRIVAPLLCCVALLAQDGPLRYVSADCEFVLRMRGPAAWQREFAATRLGQVLASPQLLPHWERLVTSFAADAEIDAEARAKFAELPEMLGNYGGEIVLAARADWETMDLDADGPSGSLLLAMAPEEGTDFGQLSERIAAMLPEAGDIEVELGDQPAPLRTGGSWQVAGPVVRDGCLILVAGNDLSKQAPAFFEVEPHDRIELADEMASGTLGMHLAVNRLLDGFCDLIGEDAGGEADLVRMVRDLGVGGISGLSVALYPDGAYVGQTLVVDYVDDTARGLIGLLLPTRRTAPKLLQYLPPWTRSFSVRPIDGARVAEFYPRLFEELGEVLPMTREQLEGQFTAFTKLRLLEDVLALIGDEYMRLEDLSEVVEYDEDMTDAQAGAQETLGNTCFVLAVRDGETFGRNLDTAIRARGLHVGRKSEEYADTKVYRMNLLGMFPIEYAVVDDLFVLGVGDGEGTKRNLRGVLDAAAVAPGVPAEFAPEVKARLDGLPEDWAGIEVASITELLDGLIATMADWEAWLAEEEIEPEELEDPWWAGLALAKALRPELARQGAEISVTVDYFTRERYLSRSRW